MNTIINTILSAEILFKSLPYYINYEWIKTISLQDFFGKRLEKKNILFLIFFSSIFIPNTSWAYGEYNDDGCLRLELASQSVGFDFRVGSNFALGVELGSTDSSLSTSNPSSSNNDYTHFTSERIGFRGVFFFTRKYNSGFYLSSTLSQVDVKADYTNYAFGTSSKTFKSNYITGNVVLGHRWFWDTFSLYIGAKKTIGIPNTKMILENPDHTEKEVDSINGNNPVAEIAIGLNF